VQGASAFFAGATLTASVCGVKAAGDLFNSTSTAGPVRALALSQLTTSALSLATLVRGTRQPDRAPRALRHPGPRRRRTRRPSAR
jgi:hypothetical protein